MDKRKIKAFYFMLLGQNDIYRDGYLDALNALSMCYL